MLPFVTLTLLLRVCHSAVLSEEGEVVAGVISGDEVVLDQLKSESAAMRSEKETENAKRDSEMRQKQVQSPCPTSGTDCDNLGGQCIPWQADDTYCDYRAWYPGLCGSGVCKCCIDCDKNFKGSRCHNVTGFSQCKKRGECHPFHYDDLFHPCPACGCSCCRPCIQTKNCKKGDSYGFCVGKPDYYVSKFPQVFLDESSICETKETDQCSCVRVCRLDIPCIKVKGYCVKRSGTCKPKYTKFDCGCVDKKNCSCCVPLSNKGSQAVNFNCPATG